jgi:predicted DNA-binding transcriptional regulator AlpA
MKRTLIFRVDEVCRATGLARTTIWRLEQERPFPARGKLEVASFPNFARNQLLLTGVKLVGKHFRNLKRRGLIDVQKRFPKDGTPAGGKSGDIWRGLWSWFADSASFGWDILMSRADALFSIAGLLLAAYVLGAIVWGLCWAVISGFLEKRPRLSSRLGRWRLLRWIAAISLIPDETARFFERVHDRTLPWQERLGWKRVARQTLCFTTAGFLILASFYLWGAYKRSVQWYEIEPPPDVSEGINTPLRPDSSAWIADWTLKGVFWSKATCVQGIRHDKEAARKLEDEVQSFVGARRCIKANSPYAPKPDSDWETSEDSGD